MFLDQSSVEDVQLGISHPGPPLVVVVRSGLVSSAFDMQEDAMSSHSNLGGHVCLHLRICGGHICLCLCGSPLESWAYCCARNLARESGHSNRGIVVARRFYSRPPGAVQSQISVVAPPDANCHVSSCCLSFQHCDWSRDAWPTCGKGFLHQEAVFGVGSKSRRKFPKAGSGLPEAAVT